MTWGLGALFLGATATVVLRRHALPGWLAWSAAAIALANLAGLAVPTADIGQIASTIFPPWILVTSIVLLRRPEEPLPAINSAPISSSPAAS